MAYRTLYFILLSCLVLCCTNKSSKNEVANLDSVQTARLVVKSIDVPKKLLMRIMIRQEFLLNICQKKIKKQIFIWW